MTFSLGWLTSSLGDSSLDWLDFGLRWPSSGLGDPSLKWLDFGLEWPSVYSVVIY